MVSHDFTKLPTYLIKFPQSVLMNNGEFKRWQAKIEMCMQEKKRIKQGLGEQPNTSGSNNFLKRQFSSVPAIFYVVSAGSGNSA